MALTVMVLLVLLPVTVLGRSTGAPNVTSVCTAMVPQHGTFQPSTGPSPFTITPSVTSYDYRSTTIDVELNGTIPFKGFLIQARSVDPARDQTVPLGDFVVATDTQQSCNGPTGSALTHINSLSKPGLVLQWNAKAGINPGHIEFLVTFVEIYTRFYVQQKSVTITEQNTGATGTTAPTTAPPVLPAATFNEDDCGSSRGCFRSPESCSGDCNYFTSWSHSSGQIDVILSAITTGYVAMGLSDDERMGSDSVIVCAIGAQAIRLEVGENFATGNTKWYGRDTQATAPQLIATTYSGGRLTCQFTISDSQQLPGGRALKDEHYVLIAKGPLNSDTVAKHDSFPVISGEQVNFLENKDYGRASAPKMVKAHGSMMIIAWILCASTGIVLARYFKTMWPKSKPGGKLVWFQVHRILMITNLLLTVAAFIVIFVYVRGYSEGLDELPGKAHPIMGIIVTAFVIINPIMAMFRCAPDAEKRPIFNWFHWAVGTSAHLLAVATVGIGVTLPSATSFTWLWYIVVGWAIFAVLVNIVLEISRCRTSSRQEDYQVDFPMKGDGVQGDVRQSNDGGQQCRCVTLAVYVIITACVVITLVVSIAAF